MKSLILIVFSIFFSYTFHVCKLLFEEKISNRLVSSILSSVLFIIYILFIYCATQNSYLLRSFIFILSTIIMSITMMFHHKYIDLLKKYIGALILFSMFALITPIL